MLSAISGAEDLAPSVQGVVEAAVVPGAVRSTETAAQQGRAPESSAADSEGRDAPVTLTRDAPRPRVRSRRKLRSARGRAVDLVRRRPATTLAIVLSLSLGGYVVVGEVLPSLAHGEARTSISNPGSAGAADSVSGESDHASARGNPGGEVGDRSPERGSPGQGAGDGADSPDGTGAANRDRSSAAGTDAGTPSENSDAPVLVHVAGEVNHPGLYRLGANARVNDAVTAAGGATASADLAGVNLARIVTDGEQILVPTHQDGASVQSPGMTTPVPGPISINTASVEQLDSLPRIGPALATRIVEWRTKHGRFRTLEALCNVPGIGQRLFESIRDRIQL